MSISTIREATTKPGCQIALGLVALLLALGMILTANPFGGGNSPAEGNSRLIMKVGTQTYNAEQIEARITQVAQSQGIERGEPQAEFQAVGLALSQIIDERIYRQLASEKGITVTDENIRSTFSDQIDFELDRIKEQIKANLGDEATPEKIEEEFTKVNGQSAEKLRSDALLQIEEVMKDTTRRGSLELNALNALLPKAYESDVVYTEEDLKKSFRAYNFDVIAIDPTATDQTNKDERIASAKEELESGTDAATVRKKYAEGSTQDKTTLTHSLISGDENLKPLLDLQVGEVSEVMDSNGFPMIYKLTNIDPGLPDDFEANKETLLADAKGREAQTAFQEALESKRESVDVEWEDDSYKLLYQAVRKLTDFSLMFQTEKLQQELTNLLTEVEAVRDNGNVDLRILALVGYNVADVLLRTAQEPEKKEEYKDIYSNALVEVFSFYESAGTRIEAANNFLQLGDNESAFEQLLSAAQVNRDFETKGQGYYAQLSAIVNQAEEDKTFEPEQIEELNTELSKYMQEKIEYDEDMAALDDLDNDVDKMLDEEEEAGRREEENASNSATTGSPAPAEETTGQ